MAKLPHPVYVAQSVAERSVGEARAPSASPTSPPRPLSVASQRLVAEDGGVKADLERLVSLFQPREDGVLRLPDLLAVGSALHESVNGGRGYARPAWGALHPGCATAPLPPASKLTHPAIEAARHVPEPTRRVNPVTGASVLKSRPMVRQACGRRCC